MSKRTLVRATGFFASGVAILWYLNLLLWG